jgi:hypothetical protein
MGAMRRIMSLSTAFVLNTYPSKAAITAIQVFFFFYSSHFSFLSISDGNQVQ